MRKELAWLRRARPPRTSKPKFRIDAANQLIEDVPPVRNPIELQRLAVARLGKDVIDLETAGVRRRSRVLRDVDLADRSGRADRNSRSERQRQYAPGPDRRRCCACPRAVKRGKTVRLGTLDQQFSQLADIGGDRVHEVLARTKTTFTIDGKDLTPAQSAGTARVRREHLSTRLGSCREARSGVSNFCSCC